MLEETREYHYENNQLLDVICQIRFPAILSVDAQEPAAFQELIRSEFPKYASRKEPQSSAPGQKEPELLTNFYFATADEDWRVHLTRHFIGLNCSVYDNWRAFAQKLDRVLAAFIEVYHPAYFSRIGLRYLNGFSREALGLEGTPWRQLIQPAYLGLLAQDDVLETDASQCVQNLEMALSGGCRLKLHCGPGLVQRKGQRETKPRYIMDIDVSMTGNLPVNQVAPALSTAHIHTGTIFENALQPALRSAMGPTEE